MPGIPTKEFFSKMEKKIGGDYTKEQKGKIIGDIWYNKMKPATKEKYEDIRRKREGKSEGSLRDALLSKSRKGGEHGE